MTLRFSKGRYVADFYVDGRGGRRVQKRLAEGISTEEAEAQYAALLRRYRVRQPAVNLGLTVSRLLDRYLEWYELHRQPRTVEDARMVFDVHIGACLGGIPAEHLEARHLLEYQARRKAQGVTGRTINKETAYLSGALRWAERNGYISRRDWRVESLPHVRPLPEVLSVEEIRALLAAMDGEPFYRALFLLLYAIGLRMNEARSMRWRDIDAPNATVTVRQKGGRFKRLPLAQEVMAALDAMAPAERNPDGYVFLSPRAEADAPHPIRSVRRAIERACRRAGITRHVHPHLFRHSFATHLMGANVNLEVVSRMLGHAQVGTTSIYLHVAQDHFRAAADIISASLGEARKQ